MQKGKIRDEENWIIPLGIGEENSQNPFLEGFVFLENFHEPTFGGGILNLSPGKFGGGADFMLRQ